MPFGLASNHPDDGRFVNHKRSPRTMFFAKSSPILYEDYQGEEFHDPCTYLEGREFSAYV